MKQHKNKIIFISVIILIVLLMVWYYMAMIIDGEEGEAELKQPEVPALEETQKEYSSKLDAINDITEEKEITAPSVYSDADMDSTGLYNPELQELRRQQIVDSIYRNGRIHYANATRQKTERIMSPTPKGSTNIKSNNGQRDFSQAHSAFYSSLHFVRPLEDKRATKVSDPFIIVEVNGQQTVRQDERLELRLTVDAKLNGKLVPRNTLIYGFVSFKPNRVLLTITNIEHRKVSLKAYDLLDGNEGIYIRNSFRGEAGREVLDDVVQDINVPGFPQVGGIKQVFRRNNRNVKVTVRNQYQLILKRG